MNGDWCNLLDEHPSAAPGIVFHTNGGGGGTHLTSPDKSDHDFNVIKAITMSFV